ncbi:MAG: zf-HC2 domain-containing protein [Candidatus Dormibacteria bacterium]
MPRDCDQWRGDLSLAAIGRLGASDRLALDAHLATCRGCSSELAELETVGHVLALADPLLVDPEYNRPPAISAAGAPPASKPATPRLRHSLRWALGGLGVAVLAGASLLWLGPLFDHDISVTLHGSRGVQATAVLTAEHWGTDLSLQVAGQPAGRVYHVSMESRSGTWWQAGSYRSESGAVRVDLACGVSPTQVDRIWVEDGSGRIVLRAYLS